MSLNKYAVFVRAAELGSLTAVANELGYTQSAVSHAIQSLENELHLQLIKRAKNGITLTQYGEELLPDFRQVVNSEEMLLQKAGQYLDLTRGTLRVGSFTSVSLHWMPEIAKRILDEYPDVRLIQSHLLFDGIASQLAAGNIDLGFLTEDDKGSFDFMPLYTDEYYVVLPAGHPLASLERIPVDTLDGERIIYMADGGSGIDSILKEIRNPQIIHYVNEDILAIPLVEKGLGISILPAMIIKHFESSAVIRPFKEPRYRTIGLAAKSFKYAPPIVEVFTRLLKEYLSDWTME